MSSYLLSVVGTVLFSSVVIALLPSGKSSELIKSIVRTACLVVILSPVAKLFVDTKNYNGIFVESGIELHKDFIEYSCKRRVQETENQLKKDLDGRFDGIHSVEVDWELKTVVNEKYSVDEIHVKNILVRTAYSFSESERRSLSDYLRKAYGCESSVCAANEQ